TGMSPDYLSREQSVRSSQPCVHNTTLQKCHRSWVQTSHRMLCVDVFKKEYLEQHDERFTKRRAEKGALMPG
uniref:Uncharacterized protein n=1 Tax=Aegilops tauschii subsp. strangulata TaxID=200361 RepID=A0A453FH94_AEGTS